MRTDRQTRHFLKLQTPKFPGRRSDLCLLYLNLFEKSTGDIEHFDKAYSFIVTLATNVTHESRPKHWLM